MTCFFKSQFVGEICEISEIVLWFLTSYYLLRLNVLPRLNILICTLKPTKFNPFPNNKF